MTIHENHILAGLRRTGMEVLIVQQERSCFRREPEDEIRIGVFQHIPVDNDDFDDLEIFGSSFVDAMSVQFGVPLIAGTLRSIESETILWTLEDGRTISARSLAHV